jgi:hypothetical protein
MEKIFYESPEMEVVKLELNKIICASDGTGGPGEGGAGDPDTNEPD